MTVMLAAAIHGGASVIVTENERDFPASALVPHNLVTATADSFILHLIERDRPLVITAIASDRADMIRPPVSAEEYLDALARGGLTATAVELRDDVDLLAPIGG